MRLRIFGIFAILTLSLSAQTVQQGVVKEYNEKAQKTPLAGVELNVRSAGSTVSDNKGDFSLSFLTLQPGEKINVRRIEKLGYEVFNKEAIEQWNLNPNNPFVIVMCKSEKFKKIRDNYEKVSSESYAKQLKKEQAALAKLKEDGKIKEAEYQKRLYELQENHERQLDNLENYIDRFSRIDLSELSSIEQEIIELVQEGRIEEAIAKYEEQNFVDRYRQEVNDIKEVSQAIDQLSEVKEDKILSRDSLLAAIDRQIETLKLAGGKENFERIGIILHDVAYSDTTLWQPMYKYGEYLLDQNSYGEALKALITASTHCNDRDANIKCQIKLSETYNDLSNFNESRNIISKLLSLENIDKNLLASLTYSLGTSLFKSTYFDDAYDSFIEALTYVENTGSPTEGIIYYGLSSLRRTQKIFDEAFEYNEKSKEIFQNLLQTTKNKAYDDRILQCEENSAKILYYSGKVNESLPKFKELTKFYDNLLKINPEKYATKLAWNTTLLAKNYFKLDMFDEAINQLDKAIEIYAPLYAEMPLAYGKSYCQVLQDYGANLVRKGLCNEAETYYEKAIDMASSLFCYDETAFRPLYFMSLYTAAFQAFNEGNFDKSIDLNLKSIELMKPLFEKDPRSYGEVYSSAILYLGESYAKLEESSKSIEMLILSKDIREKLYNMDATPLNTINIAEAYRKLASSLTNIESYPEALEYLQKAHDLFKLSSSTNEKYVKHAIAMKRNQASIYSSIYKDYKKAHDALDIAIAYDPSKIEILEQKGILYIEEGKIPEAKNILSKIIEIEPAYEQTRYSEFKEQLSDY